jgi:hypothetical protein
MMFCRPRARTIPGTGSAVKAMGSSHSSLEIFMALRPAREQNGVCWGVTMMSERLDCSRGRAGSLSNERIGERGDLNGSGTPEALILYASLLGRVMVEKQRRIRNKAAPHAEF